MAKPKSSAEDHVESGSGGWRYKNCAGELPRPLRSLELCRLGHGPGISRLRLIGSGSDARRVTGQRVTAGREQRQLQHGAGWRQTTSTATRKNCKHRGGTKTVHMVHHHCGRPRQPATKRTSRLSSQGPTMCGALRERPGYAAEYMSVFRKSGDRPAVSTGFAEVGSLSHVHVTSERALSAIANIHRANTR
jgi:hypothetical protein